MTTPTDPAHVLVPISLTPPVAPGQSSAPKRAGTPKNQLQNYGAKDMVHNEPMFLVSAP